MRRVCRQHRFEDLREPCRRDVFDAQARVDAATPSARSAPIWRRTPFIPSAAAWTRRFTAARPLLGFNGMVFKAHASARERAITSAMRVTAEALQHQVNQTIAREIARANEALAAAEDSCPCFLMTAKIKKIARPENSSRSHLLHHRRRLVCAGKNPDQRRPRKNGRDLG